MTWWVFQQKRLTAEKSAIAELEQDADWVCVGEWYAHKDLKLCVNFSISLNSEKVHLTMVYPSIYPDAPPMVFSSENLKISAHQYGAEGELCLEFRPDNWDQSIVGADMIASAHRLISGEAESASGAVDAVISAHTASIGRDTRFKFCRLLLTPNELGALNSLTENQVIEMEFHERFENVFPVALLKRLGTAEAPLFVGELVGLQGRKASLGKAVQIPPDLVNLVSAPDDLATVLKALKLDNLFTEMFDSDGQQHLLIGSNNDWRLFWLHGDRSDRKMLTYSLIPLPALMERLPAEHEKLSAKSVGIVGCGSIGSKIATTLARSGVANFFLVDEDIFFPGNIVRNELDYDYIGIHKADALKDRLKRVNPNCKVTLSHIRLGGQESSSSLSAALEKLSDSNILIDATADPVAFNMIASVSTRSKVPMVWGEVFAGGIGGLIARARPELDPTPQLARRQILGWCERRGVEWHGNNGGASYETPTDDGPPMVADDGSVAVIAAHMSRLAVDVLLAPDASNFPHSAYMIGLSSGWAFTQPFETFPINLAQEGDWGPHDDVGSPEKVFAILAEHLKSGEVADVDNDPA